MAGRWFPFRSLVHLYRNAAAYFSLLKRKDTPLSLKALAVAALLYLVSPLDLVPDWLAGLGIVDDIAVVWLILGYLVKRLQRQKEEMDNGDDTQE